MAGLPVATLAIMIPSGLSMVRVADHDVLTFVISFATAAFVVLSRRNPLWAIASGALAGIAALHLA